MGRKLTVVPKEQWLLPKLCWVGEAAGAGVSLVTAGAEASLPVYPSLLEPLSVKIDPKAQEAKQQEWEQIKNLNTFENIKNLH